MIGDRQRGLLELLGALDQIVDPVGAVEERVFRVAMEMDEGHLGEDSGRGPTVSKRFERLSHPVSVFISIALRGGLVRRVARRRCCCSSWRISLSRPRAAISFAPPSAEGRILARRRSIAEIVADSATHTGGRRQAAARARRAALRRGLDRASSEEELHDVQPARPRHAGARALRRVPRPAGAEHVVVSDRRPRAVQGLLRLSPRRASAAKQLDADGFDVYLRPSPAFSTLGWFNDPLLSTSLRADSLDLANTVIHELTHNTFYASGQAVFNESFANFVGARGSAWFFRTRGAPAAADEADARWSDEKLLARFWAQLYIERRLGVQARTRPIRAARLAARDTIYARARRELVDRLGPQLRTIGPRALERMRLDNAALLAHRIYDTDLDLVRCGVGARGRRSARDGRSHHRDGEEPAEGSVRCAS